MKRILNLFPTLSGHPPGTILQLMHLATRLYSSDMRGRSFYEIGCGTGLTSKVLLSMGMKGTGFDLHLPSCKANKKRNRTFVDTGNYSIRNENFLTAQGLEKVDLIISCMVVEHLDENSEKKFFEKALSLLKKNGKLITIVPGSMKHWTIEDDIVGHQRRYEMSGIKKRFDPNDRTDVADLRGLTYPLSNFLLPLSSFLVKRQEGAKLRLSDQERTELSGNRNVNFKTHYPSFFSVLLNPLTLLPFYILQSIFKKNTNSIVLYSELSMKK